MIYHLIRIAYAPARPSHKWDVWLGDAVQLHGRPEMAQQLIEELLQIVLTQQGE